MFAWECKIVKILLLIAGISLPAFVFFTPVLSINAQETTQTVSVSTIVNNIDKYFNDTTYGGYYSSINTNGQVANSNKGITDYIYALEVITKLIKNFNESTYLKNIPAFLNIIAKFRTNVYAYSLSETRYFSNLVDGIYASTMALMLSTYVHLYSATSNTFFLTNAINLYNFIQKYFYDPVHGGYYSELLPTGLTLGSSLQDIESYGLLAQSFLDLYTETKNVSILLNGYNLLNDTIATAFNSTYNYFVPYLEQDSTIKYLGNNFVFDTTQQLPIAEALLEYANTNLPANLVNTFKEEFIDKADKIYTDIRSNLLNNSYVMASYTVNANVHNSAIVVDVQSQFIDFLLLRKKFDPNFNQLDQNMLNQASELFSGFLSPNLTLFIRSEYLQYAEPWVNYEVLNTILNLKIDSISAPIYVQTNSAPVYQYNPNVHNYYGDTNQPLWILALGFTIIGIGVVVTIVVKRRSSTRKRIVLDSKNGGKTSKDGLKANNQIITQEKVHQATGLKLCYNCKKEVLEQDIICHNCGSKLRQP